MTKIAIDYQPTNIGAEFVPYYPGKRLRLYDKDALWFPSIGWCPHDDVGGGECRGCGLVLDD